MVEKKQMDTTIKKTHICTKITYRKNIAFWTQTLLTTVPQGRKEARSEIQLDCEVLGLPNQVKTPVTTEQRHSLAP